MGQTLNFGCPNNNSNYEGDHDLYIYVCDSRLLTTYNSIVFIPLL